MLDQRNIENVLGDYVKSLIVGVLILACLGVREFNGKFDIRLSRATQLASSSPESVYAKNGKLYLWIYGAAGLGYEPLELYSIQTSMLTSTIGGEPIMEYHPANDEP